MKQLRVYIENSVIGGYFDIVKKGYNLLEIRTPLEVI
jgi:hypothetical protein